MPEITFNNPMYLWLLASVPLMIVSHFYMLKHSKFKAMKFANFETLKRITGDKLLTRNITPLVSRVMILIFVIFAVSGAVFWYEGESNNNDFVIAIDTSASMSAQDLDPTRLEAAKYQAKQFVDALRSDARVGIVTFSGVTFINKVPTKSRIELKAIIENIDIVQAGGTDIPGAIVTSANLLADAKKGKTIIMITDGSSTVGTFLEDSIDEAIAYALDNHVIVHAIGTGSEIEQPIGYIPEYYNISAVYNEENLEKISSLTGGNYYHASDNQNLINAFREISQDSSRAKLSVNLSLGFMLFAMIILFFEWGLINLRFRRIP
ncbi:MAG: VWA domain-containing protein [archaeon]